MTETFNPVWALVLGLLATIALPIGAVVGILTKPVQRLSGALAGFGAGALFAALAIELVAPRILGEFEPGTLHLRLILILSAALGGAIFTIFDHLLNTKGGYLRKTATAILYLTNRRSHRIHRLIEELAGYSIFRSIPPHQIQLLVDRLRENTFARGELLFRQGEQGDRLFIVERGEIELIRDNEVIATVGSGELIGEIALLTEVQRTATGRVSIDSVVLELSRRDFRRICQQIPEFSEAVESLAANRLEELGKKEVKDHPETLRWASTAIRSLRRRHSVPTPHELLKEASEQSSAPMAIWLGALLDGIPESFVLGTTFFAMLSTAGGGVHPLSAIPITLLAGLFLSNFPEAMSSSTGMVNQGWSRGKILMLWGSLTLVTSFLTMGGFIMGGDVSELVKVGAEGIAAGAMMTMIAQTMIPEAVHLGGPAIVGLSTLAGFLTAVAFKVFEG